MQLVHGMVDLKRSDEEKQESASQCSPCSQPDYPYGLSISLDQDVLKKLNLSIDDVEPGDMLHMHCFATVTSKSENNDSSTGPTCRLEMQITHLEAEDETEEDKESEGVLSKLYM